MAEDKKGFILYADQKELFDQLPNDKAGKLIKHIFSYVNDENPVTEDLLIKVSFTPIKQQFKRDLKKWEKTREARSRAGKASAEARKNKKQQTSTNSTNVKNVQQSPTNSTVNDNVNVNVNDNVNVSVINKKKSIKRFFAPTVEEVDAYFLEKGLDFDLAKIESQKFINFYDSNGWKVGRNKMKKWKSAASGWITRIQDFKKEKNVALKKEKPIMLADKMKQDEYK